MDIRLAPKLAWCNRGRIGEGKIVGCYYCTNVYAREEITAWIDEERTAICPKCEADAVLSENSGYKMNSETLADIRDYWFPRLNCCHQ